MFTRLSSTEHIVISSDVEVELSGNDHSALEEETEHELLPLKPVKRRRGGCFSVITSLVADFACQNCHVQFIALTTHRVAQT